MRPASASTSRRDATRPGASGAGGPPARADAAGGGTAVVRHRRAATVTRRTAPTGHTTHPPPADAPRSGPDGRGPAGTRGTNSGRPHRVTFALHASVAGRQGAAPSRPPRRLAWQLGLLDGELLSTGALAGPWLWVCGGRRGGWHCARLPLRYAAPASCAPTCPEGRDLKHRWLRPSISQGVRAWGAPRPKSGWVGGSGRSVGVG